MSDGLDGFGRRLRFRLRRSQSVAYASGFETESEPRSRLRSVVAFLLSVRSASILPLSSQHVIKIIASHDPGFDPISGTSRSRSRISFQTREVAVGRRCRITPH